MKKLLDLIKGEEGKDFLEDDSTASLVVNRRTAIKGLVGGALSTFLAGCDTTDEIFEKVKDLNKRLVNIFIGFIGVYSELIMFLTKKLGENLCVKEGSDRSLALDKVCLSKMVLERGAYQNIIAKLNEVLNILKAFASNEGRQDFNEFAKCLTEDKIGCNILFDKVLVELLDNDSFKDDKHLNSMAILTNQLRSDAEVLFNNEFAKRVWTKDEIDFYQGLFGVGSKIKVNKLVDTGLEKKAFGIDKVPGKKKSIAEQRQEMIEGGLK